MNKLDFLVDFPRELYFHIFSSLEVIDLVTVSQACKVFSSIVDNHSIEKYLKGRNINRVSECERSLISKNFDHTTLVETKAFAKTLCVMYFSIVVLSLKMLKLINNYKLACLEHPSLQQNSSDKKLKTEKTLADKKILSAKTKMFNFSFLSSKQLDNFIKKKQPIDIILARALLVKDVADLIAKNSNIVKEYRIKEHNRMQKILKQQWGRFVKGDNREQYGIGEFKEKSCDPFDPIDAKKFLCDLRWIKEDEAEDLGLVIQTKTGALEADEGFSS